MLLGSIRNRVTRNTGMDKNREMKKKSYVQTDEASWLISLGIGLKYLTLYAVSVNGALPLPPCIWLMIGVNITPFPIVGYTYMDASICFSSIIKLTASPCLWIQCFAEINICGYVPTLNKLSLELGQKAANIVSWH